MKNLHNIKPQNVPDWIKAWLWWWTVKYPKAFKCKYNNKGMWLLDNDHWSPRSKPNDMVNSEWVIMGKQEPNWAMITYEESS